MINLDNMDFVYEPYPIGCARGVFCPHAYDIMLAAWPETKLFHYRDSKAVKYALSEYNNPENYHALIRRSSVWRELYGWIKSDDFISSTIDLLKTKNIDLGLDGARIRSRSTNGKRRARSSLWSRIRCRPELRARFEFSMMGGQGGCIRPHADEPRKLVTMVLTMVRPGEWQQEWGGGTSVSLPKDRSLIYNQQNKYLEFEDMETIRTYEFAPNQCVLFIKTYNSWHHVAPIAAPSPDILRRTLTINIERLK